MENKISIKTFCEEYMKTDNSRKDDYIKENLKIVDYVPFIQKMAIAQNLVNTTVFKHENYKKEDGSIGSKRTNIVKLNSTVQQLLFCRLMIETYTNLKAETEGFYEEYDLLNMSGLSYKLFANSAEEPSLIPIKEIEEMQTIIRMEQDDAIFNYGTPQSYISNQIDRISTIFGTVLNPVLEKLVKKFENMDEKDVEKLTNQLEKVFKRNIN